MLSHITVATDGSEGSDHLIECVKELRRVGSRVALLTHVFNVRDVGGLYATFRESMLPNLEKQKGILEEAGFQVQIETPVGVPFFEINRLAHEHSSSLIVIGSLGESLVSELLLGSTAHSVLQNAVLPVFLLRLENILENGGKRCRGLCQELFRHILFPTDFSDTAERAFLYLEHVVRESGAHVTLLHIQDRSKIEKHLRHRLEEFNQIDAERLERMKVRLQQCGAVSVDIEISYGLPIAVILERSRSNTFSLMLMGSQGRGFVHEIFLGSVANAVARLAPLPVLFVPMLR